MKEDCGIRACQWSDSISFVTEQGLVRKAVLVLSVPCGWVQVYSDGSGFTVPLHHTWPLLLNILWVAAAVYKPPHVEIKSKHTCICCSNPFLARVGRRLSEHWCLAHLPDRTHPPISASSVTPRSEYISACLKLFSVSFRLVSPNSESRGELQWLCQS